MAKNNPSDRSRLCALSLFISGGVLSLVFIVAAILMTVSRFADDTAGSGAIWRLVAAIAAVLLVMTVIAGLYVLIRTMQQTRTSSELAAARLDRVESLLEGQEQHMHELIENTALSDQAKSLIYFEQEMEAFRETIHAMLLKQDYSAAEAMVERMEKQFGLTEEASRMRDEVASYRQKTVNDKVQAAIDRIEEILERHEWAQARREAERVAAMYPDEPAVDALQGRIQEAWNEYKRQLLKDYGEAVRVNDVERSIELLKELDKYLTPQEGAALAESARGIFKAKLHNLGVQFAISVTDKQWASAVETGEQIIEEFPNSRMAREVSEKLDTLRDYATGAKQPPNAHQFVGGPGARA